ncbi:MAG: hypothetical protein K0R54_211 [Clostridiaceae bacterium]|nr:hypothetical protein [Clostridiaceae bacterium]
MSKKSRLIMYPLLVIMLLVSVFAYNKNHSRVQVNQPAQIQVEAPTTDSNSQIVELDEVKVN